MADRLVTKGTRLSIQMFAKELKAEDAEFRLEANLAFGDKQYEVINLEYLEGLKNKQIDIHNDMF